MPSYKIRVRWGFTSSATEFGEALVSNDGGNFTSASTVKSINAAIRPYFGKGDVVLQTDDCRTTLGSGQKISELDVHNARYRVFVVNERWQIPIEFVVQN